jgi:hypothetical protein
MQEQVLGPGDRVDREHHDGQPRVADSERGGPRVIDVTAFSAPTRSPTSFATQQTGSVASDGATDTTASQRSRRA